MHTNQIVILHIPKTAGSSLRELIRHNYKKNECFYVYGKESAFTTLDDYRSLPLDKKKSYKIIMGHMTFNATLFAGLNPVYVTFVRNPIERVISYYHHVMMREKQLTGSDISLLKYLDESNDMQLNNHQTQVISGTGGLPVTQESLDAAIKNIDEKFIFTGIVEKFRESVESLCNLFGWKDRKITYANTSANRPPMLYFSNYEIEKIIELNSFDIKLYDYVNSRFCK